MKRIVFFLGFLLISFLGEAQDFKKYANLICDSIKTLKISDSDSLIDKQIDIQAKVIEDSLPQTIANGQPDIKRRIDIFNYKLIRELIKICPDYKNRFFPKPFSSVVDLDSIFSYSQKDSLNELISNIKTTKKIQIQVLEIDDLFPFDNLDNYSFKMLKDWHIGNNFSKGGVIVIFSKALRKIRISTTNVAQNYLTDSECQNIIDNIIVPNFKAGQYFQGIYNLLKEIEMKI